MIERETVHRKLIFVVRTNFVDSDGSDVSKHYLSIFVGKEKVRQRIVAILDDMSVRCTSMQLEVGRSGRPVSESQTAMATHDWFPQNHCLIPIMFAK